MDRSDQELPNDDRALQESAARLKLAFQATRSGLWDWDIQENSAHISEEYARLFGLPPDVSRLSFEQWLNCLHPDDRARAGAIVTQMIEQKQDYYEDEYRIVHTDGVRWMAVRGQVLYDATGNAIRMLGHAQDITDRKQAEAALRSSEERYRSLVEATTQSVWVIDAAGRNIGIAASWVETTGQAPPLGSAWQWLEQVHPDDRDRVRTRFTHSLETGELYEIEHRVLAKNGDYRLYWVKGVPVYNND